MYLSIIIPGKKFSKLFEPFWTIKNLKLSPSANHGGRYFFENLVLQTSLVLHYGPDVVPLELNYKYLWSSLLGTIDLNEKLSDRQMSNKKRTIKR